MRWLYYGGRACLFRHKWTVVKISKESFQVSEHCRWCGKTRVRGLLPSDEEKRDLDIAYQKGRQQRLRFLDEIKYEMARGSSADSARITSLKADLSSAKRNILDEIRAETRKGNSKNLKRIQTLQSQMRGLLFGKH